MTGCGGVVECDAGLSVVDAEVVTAAFWVAVEHTNSCESGEIFFFGSGKSLTAGCDSSCCVKGCVKGCLERLFAANLGRNSGALGSYGVLGAANETNSTAATL